MHLFENDADPIRPDACRLLDEIGLDAGCVREAIADDRARSCPWPEPPSPEGWREAEEG